MPVPAPDQLAGLIRAQPWAPRLLAALAGVTGVHLVGGAVRDLLLGHPHPDLDLVVEGDATSVARALADRIGGSAVIHERFGTASVTADELALDLATARAEVYAAPGALPEVRPGTLAEDLLRRDFTVNAIAVALDAERLGEPHAAPHAFADIDARLIRVLHPASFRDDPTRLLRAVRYAAKLGFELEPGTAALAREAAAAGALATVSGARVRDELLDLLGAPEAPRAVAGVAALGLAEALHPLLRADAELVGRAQALAPADARRDLLALAACARALPADELRGWLDDLALEAHARDVVLRAARAPQRLAAAMLAAARDSDLGALLEREPVEAVALAGALGAPEPARRWLAELRGVRLEVDGGDLLAAGVPEGPAIGAGLAAALARKRDGEISGRPQELAAALAAARSAGSRRG